MTPARPPHQPRPADAVDGARLQQQRAARQALIDLANERMCSAKRVALDAYGRVHTADHIVRCPERCREAHRVLTDAMADANAEYQAGIDEGRQ